MPPQDSTSRRRVWGNYTPPLNLKYVFAYDKRCNDMLEKLKKRHEGARASLSRARAFERSEKKLASWVNIVGSHIKLTDTWNDMADMKQSEIVVAAAGGIDEIMRKQKVCADYNKKMEEEKAAQTMKESSLIHQPQRQVYKCRDINSEYHQLLVDREYVPDKVYMFTWSHLVDFYTQAPLPLCYSFAILLGNNYKDPKKLHIRLPFVEKHTPYSELLVTDTGKENVVRVTRTNYTFLYTTVFATDNIDLLYRADGGGAISKDSYVSKLRNDSEQAILAYR